MGRRFDDSTTDCYNVGMASRGDSKTDAAIAGALVGAGIGMVVGAALAGSGVDRRPAFIQRMSERLATRGVTLLASELGRDAERPIWVLTLQLPNHHVLAVHAPVEPPGDPLSLEMCDAICLRVLQHVL